MMSFKEVIYSEPFQGLSCIMVGDIGGTNSNFGFFREEDDTYTLLFSLHVKSQEITYFPSLIKDIIDYVKNKYQVSVVRTGFASAGVVSEEFNYSKPTNLRIVIDINEIMTYTGVPCSCIINDFAVIGYGLALINPSAIVLVHKGKEQVKANKGIVGAGTGLGKCIMNWSSYADRYVPVASEGGHADFAVHNQLEFDLVNYIKKTEQLMGAPSWEDLLSGNGIERIYHFFHHNNKQIVPAVGLAKKGPHPDEIFNSRLQDEHAWRTFELYTKIYARCVKNFALDALALGGMYIAGGIAAKNLPMFELDIFREEFINSGKQHDLLQKVPIYVITDYNVSLYGIVHYMKLESRCF